MDRNLIVYLLICQVSAAVAYLWHTRGNSAISLLFARFASGIGVALNTAFLVLRTINSGHLPGASLFEFGLAMVWSLAVVAIMLEWRWNMPTLSELTMVTASLLTLFAIVTYHEPRTLMPALKSPWLAVHILVAVISYGLLAVSACSALLFWVNKQLKVANDDSVLSQAKLVNVTNILILSAMPFLTLLIVTGAVWAEYAWGAYWRWDPKETWSLITWLIYCIYLHGHLTRRWTESRSMGLALLGFAAVIFTYIGVSYLLPGLHSYN